MHYDWIIVGGGPSGLTCASFLPGNVLLLEKRKSVGGCHRVQWSDAGLFSEHGPRVYSGSYINLDKMMRMHGIQWDNVFQSYTYTPDHLDGTRWYRWMTWRALIMVTVMTLSYLVGMPLGGSMRDACEWWHIDPKTTRYIDTVCRFSDGAGIDRYRQSQFVAGFDYHVIYGFYVPRRSLDIALWAPWVASLRRRGVVVRTGARVERVLVDGQNARGVVLDGGGSVFATRGVILCLPPTPLSRLLNRSGLYDFERVAKATRYIPYYSYSLHFTRGYTGPLVCGEGFQDTPWGLIYIELDLENLDTRILSVAITRVDAASPATGYAARGLSNDRIETELLRQLPLTPHARIALLEIVATKEGDHASIDSVGSVKIPQRHPHVPTLGMVCCANGLSQYPFTSIECAIQNAMVFCQQRPSHPWTIRSITAILAVLVFVGYLGSFAVGR